MGVAPPGLRDAGPGSVTSVKAWHLHCRVKFLPEQDIRVAEELAGANNSKAASQ
jgi:hypothetical protein